MHSCRQARKRTRHKRAGAHAGGNDLDYVERRGHRAVGNNALNVLRQLFFTRRHKHGCATHRNAVKQYRHLAKAIVAVFDPAHNVARLLDAKGDGLTLAFAVRALIDHKQVVPKRLCDLVYAAKVTLMHASVSVTKYLYRCAVGHVVIACGKTKPIARGNIHALGGQICNIGNESTAADDLRVVRVLRQAAIKLGSLFRVGIKRSFISVAKSADESEKIHANDCSGYYPR